MRGVRGCDEPTATPQFEFEGENLDQCPMKFLKRQSLQYMRHFRFFQMGWLPQEGGIMDQTAKFVEAMEYLGIQFAKVKENAEQPSSRTYPPP
jgi:hypothetical protein